MNYTVAVSVPFNRSCVHCLQGTEQALMAAIRDPQVTSISARVVPKCDHETAPPKLDAVDDRAQLLPGILNQPESDTNGFEPVGRA